MNTRFIRFFGWIYAVGGAIFGTTSVHADLPTVVTCNPTLTYPPRTEHSSCRSVVPIPSGSVTSRGCVSGYCYDVYEITTTAPTGAYNAASESISAQSGGDIIVAPVMPKTYYLTSCDTGFYPTCSNGHVGGHVTATSLTQLMINADGLCGQCPPISYKSPECGFELFNGNNSDKFKIIAANNNWGIDACQAVPKTKPAIIKTNDKTGTFDLIVSDTCSFTY